MSPNRVMDSNGPDMKVRGSAAHITEKYRQLARDANAAGDRVAAENYLQHAEHYHRLLATMQEHSAQQKAQQQANAPQPNGRDDRRDHPDRDNRPTESSEDKPEHVADSNPETPRSNGATPDNSDDVEARIEPQKSSRRKPKAAEAEDGQETPKPRRRPRKPAAPESEPAKETEPTGD